MRIRQINLFIALSTQQSPFSSLTLGIALSFQRQEHWTCSNGNITSHNIIPNPITPKPTYTQFYGVSCHGVPCTNIVETLLHLNLFFVHRLVTRFWNKLPPRCMELSHDKRQDITVDYNHYVTHGWMVVSGGLYRAVKCGDRQAGQIKCCNNTRTNGPKIPNRAHNGIQLNGSQTTAEQIGNKIKVWFTWPEYKNTTKHIWR